MAEAQLSAVLTAACLVMIFTVRKLGLVIAQRDSLSTSQKAMLKQVTFALQLTAAVSAVNPWLQSPGLTCFWSRTNYDAGPLHPNNHQSAMHLKQEAEHGCFNIYAQTFCTKKQLHGCYCLDQSEHLICCHASTLL